MDSICPRCRSFQSTAYCPACGSSTRSANGCSQCPCSFINGKFCGDCGAPSWRTVIQQGGGFPKTGSQQEIRRQGSRPNDVKVDTSSIIGQGITPSAVFRGVNTGEETISKYRIQATEDPNENIDWRQTIKNASRAAVDEPDEVMAQRIVEPSVQVSHQTHYSRPANVGPLPSEQLRNNPEALSRPTPPTSPTIVPRQPSHPAVTKTGNLPPPPGPSRAGYTPPQQQQNVYRPTGVTVVSESTVKPSLLRDNSDPLGKYRINENQATDPNEGNTIYADSNPDTNDPLQKYRVKTAEEEESTFHFYLSGLTAEPGRPVELICDGQVVFWNEGGNGGIVNTHASYTSISDATSVVLNIKSIPFTVNKNLEIAKGRFVRFAVDKGTGALRFRQQRTEIDD